MSDADRHIFGLAGGDAPALGGVGGDAGPGLAPALAHAPAPQFISEADFQAALEATNVQFGGMLARLAWATAPTEP